MTKKQAVNFGSLQIGLGNPSVIVAELSGNHNQSFEGALSLLRAAAEAGADAVKLQTYTADTITIKSDRGHFRIGEGLLGKEETLYSLYARNSTPWEWQPKLKDAANDLGLELFSSPFDSTAADFLADMDIPAFKIASFEIVDLPLIRHVATKGKPLIVSTGMATLAEIEDAISAARHAGCYEIVLLKCTSNYPALPEEMNLKTIPHLAETFMVPAGLSDHTRGIAVPVAAVAIGALMIEKHLTLNRAAGGAESGFALEPDEFRTMVQAVRTAEKALGEVHYGLTEAEQSSRTFRRSLFTVEDIKAGELMTMKNFRSIRPGHGLAPKNLENILGKQARVNISRGTPLSWDLIK
ncbi:pseudaminic acid synthase [Acidobacteriota bacterium]